MMPTLHLPWLLVALVAPCPTGAAGPLMQQDGAGKESEELFAETFDVHWNRLQEEYPYFELYGVDWEAERDEHRPRAVEARDATEFAWEMARLISALPDPHVSILPAPSTMAGKWSYPELKTRTVERRLLVIDWPDGMVAPEPPTPLDGPFNYPEIVTLQGEPAIGAAHILAAGPLGSSFEVTLQWPDGSKTDHKLHRPLESNLPPQSKHFGENWLVAESLGSVGYLRIRTFDPKLASLGPDGKITTQLRASLKKLRDTESLILDLQGNGGGLVAASDPFLGHLLKKTRRYAWGNADGKDRVIRRRSPHYSQEIVVLVDEKSASGGEWAARILRDAGRAVTVGGRTMGAEAAVHTSTGPDGSIVKFSAWPMIEEGVTPFQEQGIQLDHPIPLTIRDVQEHGYDGALSRVRRARYAKALELLGAPAGDLNRLIEIAAPGFE